MCYENVTSPVIIEKGTVKRYEVDDDDEIKKYEVNEEDKEDEAKIYEINDK